MLNTKNGNGRLWAIAGGFALFLLVSGGGAIGFVVTTTKAVTTNTVKITTFEDRLIRIEDKLDVLLQRPQ